MKRVSYIFPTQHHFRLPFHERLRELLRAEAVDYRVVYCDPGEENRKKRDTVEIPWGVKVPITRLFGGIDYQHGMREARKSDLVIVQQENSLLFNYLCNLLSMTGKMRLAYFGHGRNFQSRNPDGLAERFKRFWATRADWWFGYTDETRRHIESLGFPANRITVFNNAVDTHEAQRLADAVTPAQLTARRAELGLVGDNVCVFVGGLYADKRLDFLLDAAERIRARLPDFEFVLVGGGVMLDAMREAADSRPWLKVTGPRFGADKAELMKLGKLYLMPGLVGLGILDAAAAGLPMVTTAFPYHSPEIAYLEDGVSGVMVPAWEDPQAYADAVADLLEQPERLDAMARAARGLADRYTIDAMAERFAQGVLQALASPPKKRVDR